MESLGLLETRAGEGTFLAGLPGSFARDPFTASLLHAWSAQSKLFEVRRVLEPGLAALAARRATAAQIEKLRSVLSEQKNDIRRGGTGMKEDTAFHFLLAEATGNEVLLRIVDSLMDLLRETREASLQRGGRPARSLKQHRAVLRAIEARNSALAERRMREHIRDIEELAFTAQQRPGEQSPSPPPSPAEGRGGAS
jgi:GntR family transcriptional repressor for pyruvate dehydrogenase complex